MNDDLTNVNALQIGDCGNFQVFIYYDTVK